MNWHEGELGTTAELLLAGGDEQSAALLLDVKELSFIRRAYTFADVEERIGYAEDGPGLVWMPLSRAVLSVEPWMIDRFTEEVRSHIHSSLMGLLLSRREMFVEDLDVVAANADPDWRDQLGKAMSKRASNQGALTRRGTDLPHEDRVTFASKGELLLYEAGKRAQAKLPSHDNLTLIPRPAVRLPNKTKEPDLLVIYRGRVAKVDVDGPHHRGKWADDHSRDQLFEDAGFAYITHIDISDTEDVMVLDGFFDRLLKKLAG
jgi:hypothetical protein